MAPLNIWLPQKLGVPYGREHLKFVWSFAVVAAWLQWNRSCPPRQQLDLDGLQTLVLVLGFGPGLLCFFFGLTPIDAKLSPPPRKQHFGEHHSLPVLTLLAIICFQIWGQYSKVGKRGQSIR